MSIVDWAKQNKLAAGAIGVGGLFFILHRGNAANSADVTSSDGTVSGAPADGQHVQLIPVSASDPSMSLDNSLPTDGGVTSDPSTTDPNAAQQAATDQFQNFLDFLDMEKQYAAGQTSPNGQTQTPVDMPTQENPTTVPAGPASSGAISAQVAQGAATNPAGHPGYKTIIKNSAKYDMPYVYHQEVRPGGHVVDIPIRPASSAPTPSPAAAPAPSHPAAAPSAPAGCPSSHPYSSSEGCYRVVLKGKERWHYYSNGREVRVS